jgi:hypothetical protein
MSKAASTRWPCSVRGPFERQFGENIRIICEVPARVAGVRLEVLRPCLPMKYARPLRDMLLGRLVAQSYFEIMALGSLIAIPPLIFTLVESRSSPLSARDTVIFDTPRCTSSPSRF